MKPSGCRVWLALCILCFALALPSWASFQVPKPQGFVTDNAGLLSPGTEATITRIAQELDSRAKAQIAVLTVNSLQGESLEQAALKTARQWHVGHKNTNTGLLILVAKQDRKFRIEVGYGLEGIITDGTAGHIRDTIMRPQFKQGNFDAGILQAVAYCAQRVAQDRDISLQTLSEATMLPSSAGSQAPSEKEIWETVIAILLVFGFSILIFCFLILPLVIKALRRMGLYQNKTGKPDFWDTVVTAGGSSDSSCGDFGGFSGGDFGGGGASGDW